MNAVERFYSDTKTPEEAGHFVFDMIDAHLNLNRSEVFYIESTSCGSVISTSRNETMQEYPMNIGGLGGFPFHGLSALNLVPRNVPGAGAVLIFYVADIDLNGESVGGALNSVGPGRNSATSIALNKLMNNQILVDHLSDLDYQMNFIEQVLLREQRRIRSASVPLFEAGEVMFEAIDKRIKLLFSKTNYKCRYVILAGGIHFTDHESNESRFVFKRFDCVDPQTKTKIDWTKIRSENESVIP